ncbi:MAG TPA: GGDEF domain-containing protein [Rhodanobacter sp.]|nr:GGDEF domain-containing protein [Rhodanobacter sp.]
MNTQQSVTTRPEALEQLERAQASWSHIDTLLRRLATRLTYAADGRTTELDETLDDLRRQLREPLDEPALESLLAALIDAVRSLDAPSRGPKPTPATPAPAAVSTAWVLLQLIDLLSLDDASNCTLDNVREAVLAAADDTELARQAEVLARLVNRHHRELGAQRVAAERLLSHVTRQLGELAQYLDRESVDRLDGSGARQELDRNLTSEFDALDNHLQQSPDLNPLHLELQSRMSAITSHLKTFRDREEARERDWQVRSEQMSQRIHELERSAQTMEASLRQEHQLASTDPLTGLANRAVFQQRMTLACRELAQEGKGACLVVLDIDHFKQINDRFGHAAGDRALRIVAEQLKARLRGDDLLVRYGGEEFVVVLPGTSVEAGHRVAEDLRTCIEGVGFRGQQQPVRITLSCGITALRSDDTPEQAFDRADRALYRAKDNGRNRCELA